MSMKLHYTISNNGDGSASLRLHKSREEAKARDEQQTESDDGFAEDTAGSIELKVEDGKVYFNHRYLRTQPKYEYVQEWVELKA